jgi:hypothetical protein
VEVEHDVELLSADVAEKGQEIPAWLLGGDDEDAVDVGMAFDQAPVGLLDEVGQPSLGKALPEKGEGGGGQYDVADPAEADEEDFRVRL